MNDIKHKVISVSYSLFKDTANGEMIETTEGKDPLTFLSGVEQMIPDFESNVVSLNVGDDFSFGIKSEKAYGSRTDEAVMDLPQDIFMQDGKIADEIQPGKMIPLQDQNGNVIPAIVVKINKETITIDLNHPLADQDLHFTGKVVEIREATADEISHGHVHGPGGHHHEK